MLIIICDDDQDHRELHAALLSQRGHEVDAVGDPVTVLRQLAARKYDLVISALIMPEINGYELLQEAHRLGHTVPFVLFSGHTTVINNPRHYRELGFAAVLSKDVSIGHFLAEIEQIGTQATERLEDV